ncbi:PepSY domain-containing protein [Paracoccus sp. MC1862]|uniref:PepSY domain-containing protein n=1 Tax=Paracoccus sp. MC1862 TaxID=2760307 RepID=UPI00160071AB|nr:PepSY domain-containing protein [Paracoccus sp. MC1862]MBB1498633.1 PepSY domain-containing protein [Paracoccus sp. MC1862]QQO46144.1 PepSY domain-containing protein [Paracoccus sp. MC1862]
MIRTGLAALALGALALPALADTPPPADAQPLSRIVATVEANVADLAFIEDVSWDDDGYWEVEYRTTGGREVEIKVDPVSGQTR